MPHQLNRLTARTVAAATKSGLYADGGGLYLRVGRGGAKSWCLRYMLEGKAREMGLGGLAKIGLADARKKAAAQRLLLVDKIDPLQRREAENSAKKVEAARSMIFAQCAKAYIDSHTAGWRNAKHAQQWTNTLATYVYPEFGSVPVGDVDVAMVMRVLEPIWTPKPETASRVRGRIEAVLDWAKGEASEPAKTRRGGAGIFRICCRQARRCEPSSTIRRFRTPKSAPSWLICESGKGPQPARWNS
jgi:Arm DNA-binding domain